jgi:protein tweety
LFSFRPDSELYLESLGIICSVPAAWLICTLVILLIYLLTRCCDTKNNKVRICSNYRYRYILKER